MDGRVNNTSGNVYNARNMPASNGFPVSVAMLLDPKSIKKQAANGIEDESPSFPPKPMLRHQSEPLDSSFPLPYPEANGYYSKDDAHVPYKGRGKRLPQSDVPPFNARQLLDPKGFQQKPQQPREDVSSPKANGVTLTKPTEEVSIDKPTEGTNAFQGLGGMIERIHGISDRQERPQKRQKLDHEDGDDNKQTFSGGGKGGEISEYLKEKRKEGKDDAASASVVDLTGGDDDEIVVVSDNSQEKEVCYGRIEGAKVLAHQLPDPGPKANYLSRSEWPAMKLQFKRFPGNDNIVRVLDPTGKDFGNLDVKTALGLSKLLELRNPRFRAQARLLNRKKKEGRDQYPTAPCSEYFDLFVNVYGPKNKAESVGRFFKSKMIKFLQPFGVDAGKEICNPHEPAGAHKDVLPRTSYASSANSTVGYVSRTAEEIRNDVLGMFDSLQKSETLPEMEAPESITTPLLGHQKQALHFMVSKEQERVFGDNEEDNNSLWRLRIRPNGQRTYYNVITGQEEHKKPPECLGGILADMMGLGKTLSILSLVAHGLSEAREFGKKRPPLPEEDEAPLVRNSQATLLVSPLSTVANWEEQIKTHIEGGALKYYVYHGSNRNKDINTLSSFDLIITTYQIISSEFSGRGSKKGDSPLYQTNFFRIVLDEAHSIREQASRQSQAICALSAQRRWAVTGTPVQNRLDDLGALIKFLRVKPFSDRGGFGQYILSPFKMADPEILPKLRLLVDSITLRRLKDRIDLPDRRDEIVRLRFNAEEGKLYEWFAKDSDRRMRIIASEQKKSLGGKTYVHILKAIMRLRLICAHGRELLSEDDLKLTEGFSMTNAIDLDSDENENDQLFTNARQAYEMLMLFRETDTDTCAHCLKKIEPDLEVAAPDKDQTIGYMMPCYQMVCEDCLHKMKKNVDTSGTHFTCPYCNQYMRVSFFELTKDGIESAEEARERAREDPKHAKVMARYGGPHTKTKALLAALAQSKIESQDLPPGEQPIKSVVFSGWTSHLDLIQIALEENKIRHVRLDGKKTRKERGAALDAFRDDPNITVILISIGAGGLGLNLTAGSKVYVMEPQFNPAAEAQAVDRVHRLGQTREVAITRYIMESSFEEKMLALQKKKQRLADLSMNRGKLDKAEAAKQRLEELRSLFK
ncbi:MAG: hypothetical protein L6R39_005889 [Caloplaca ligustica]|nr:MAG: hypothetical protein L6R39_005889 [Caloplaca ligustica]